MSRTPVRCLGPRSRRCAQGSLRRRLQSVFCVTCLAAVLVPSAASAAWTEELPKNPTGGSDVSLDGVSCVSTECEAVGSYFNSSNEEVPLAEKWNGKWELQTIKAPASSVDASLSGISCTSISFCEAVGSYENKSGEAFTLAYEWNGSSWELQTTANQSAHLNVLFSVSCITSSDCEAVGSYGKAKEFTLAEKWNGKKWELQSSPNAAGGEADALTSVSCVEGCEAVGSYQLAGERLSLAEGWNGSTWEVQSTPTPSSATYTASVAVSCVGTICESVGNYETKTSESTFGMAWNGSKWSLQTAPNPSVKGVFEGVSCVSSKFCEGVGYVIPVDPLGAEWDGTSWEPAQTIPSPSGGTEVIFNADSCTSSSFCMAVGSYENSASDILTLAEKFT
jgi:opacity protein-like surface antigen